MGDGIAHFGWRGQKQQPRGFLPLPRPAPQEKRPPRTSLPYLFFNDITITISVIIRLISHIQPFDVLMTKMMMMYALMMTILGDS